VPTVGAEPQQLTFVEHGSNDTPRWSADGRYLYFLSSRVDVHTRSIQRQKKAKT